MTKPISTRVHGILDWIGAGFMHTLPRVMKWDKDVTQLLDAAAVARNFDVYGKGNKELRLPVSEVINNYERSEVIDPLTVRFRFSRPSPGGSNGARACSGS